MAGDRTQIGIDIDAVDDASDTIDDVADKAKKLEELSPTVEVGGDTAKAETALADVKSDAERITGEDYRLVLKAQIDDAKQKLAQIDTDLDNLEHGSVKRAGDGVDHLGDKFGKAGDAAKGFAGGTASEIAAMTGAFGPAGEAVGQLTEGLLEGGQSMTGLLTAGAGIGATALVMNELSSASERAAKRAQDVADSITEINRASDEQALNQFAQTVTNLVVNGTPLKDYFADLAEGSIEGARRLLELLTQQGASAVYTDQLTTAIKEEERARKQNTTTTETYGDAVADSTEDIKNQKAERFDQHLRDVDAAARAAKDGIDALRAGLNFEAEAENLETELTGAINGFNQYGVQPTREQLRQMKQDIINVGETAGATDVEIETQLRNVDAGDYAAVKAASEAWARLNPILLATALAQPNNRIKNPVPGNPSPDGGTYGATTVNVMMPAGSRGVDVVRQLTGHARRAGRFYGAAVVTHARR